MSAVVVDSEIIARRQDLVLKYRGFAVNLARRCYPSGVLSEDAMSESFVGLAIAAEKFDPDRGILFSTYAAYWVRAMVLDHMVRNHGPVRFGTTNEDRKVFFSLGRARRAVGDDSVMQAEYLGVSENVLERVKARLRRDDVWLDAPRMEGARPFNLLAEGADSETLLVEAERNEVACKLIRNALRKMPKRERRIVEARHLRDPRKTLNELGKEFGGLSRERVRQIELQAMSRLRTLLLSSKARKARSK